MAFSPLLSLHESFMLTSHLSFHSLCLNYIELLSVFPHFLSFKRYQSPCLWAFALSHTQTPSPPNSMFLTPSHCPNLIIARPCSSVQFSCSVVSDSLQPHESQHTRPPCPSPTHRVHTNSCASSQWCHPAISSSVVPFSCCPQSLPAIRVFSNKSTLRMRWPKYWSFSFSIIPSKEIPGLIFRMD